jgi:hypothetical protein
VIGFAFEIGGNNFIYRHIKHICKYYQVVDSGNSVSTHPLEDSLRSIESASCLHF